MAFKKCCVIILLILVSGIQNIVSAQSTGQSNLSTTVQVDSNSVSINGAIMDSLTGKFPSRDSLFVTIDSRRVAVDSEGMFGVKVEKNEYHMLSITSIRFERFSQVITENPAKKNYFITCVLHHSKDTLRNVIQTPEKNEKALGPCWTLSGCIVDSKHDLAIESDSFTVYFDYWHIDITKKGSFFITECKGGLHTFNVEIPGYHNAIEQIELKTDEKQLFITIPTTKLQNKITRREITVTANREPVHVTAEVSKTELTRTEIKRAAASLDDPLRVVQTLPGVAEESDVSARPVVRGGEPRETRVFLDGVSLVQPYHFGGGRSMFNELAMDNMTLYKSGFPANYSNAQSALLVVSSRKPAEEPYALDLNVNMLQADSYIGIPLFNNKAGFYAACQGSYQDFILKRLVSSMDFINTTPNNLAADNQLKQDVHLPDYMDFSTGLEFRPTDKVHVFINEMYNTDQFKYIEQSEYGIGWENTPRDTFIDYKSYYNVLSGAVKYLPTADNVVTLTGAWQKRWWDLKFPEPYGAVYDTSIYNVNLTQLNCNANWLCSGIHNHILNMGFQIDHSHADYDVNVARAIHQIILDGNTNFADFWGPLTQDNGITLTSHQFFPLNTHDMLQHVFVKYKGYSKWFNEGLYLRDEWNATPRLSLDLGARIELSGADSSATFSPRISAKYSLSQNHELVFGTGLYTQNNYDISSIALSNDLKPEKVWHSSIGEESRLLPWLSQKIDLYGKYYYDLFTEVIKDASNTSSDSIYRTVFGSSYADSVAVRSPQALSDMLTEYRYENDLLESSYENKGKGYAYGFEYFLKYDPYDFWNGWISLTFSHSMRQDFDGGRWYPFRLDRPVMISLVNYYRLPRTYEISVKYHFMSGLPYTSAIPDGAGTIIGPANDSRYTPYQRLDFKFSKGFTIKDSKAHFYIEAWNVFNNPNAMMVDKNSKQLIAFDMNLPITMLFVGLDFQW